MKEMIKGMAMVCMRMLCHIFYIFKIQSNKIMFESNGGSSYLGNPKCISDRLAEIGAYDIYWGYRNEKFGDCLQNQVKGNSVKYLYHMLTARVIVANCSIKRYLPIRKGQIFINTWHGGGAYKRIPTAKKDQKRINEQTKYVVSSSLLFEKYVIREGLGFTGKVLNTGMPRNDIFFADVEQEHLNKIRNKLGVRDKKAVMFAPTWRESKAKGTYDLDYEMLCESLHKRFGGEWVVLIRFHYLAYVQGAFEGKSHMIDVTKYPDMQELLLVADALITDYSSVIWDYSLTGKPCFLYATDIGDYKQERDFYISIDEWPFPLAKSNDELEKAIEDFDEDRYREDVDRHHQKLGSYENGTACNQLVDFIIKSCSNR